MQINWDRAASVLMTTATIAVAVTLVHREFVPAQNGVRVGVRAPENVQRWRDILPAGRLLGDSAAAVKVIEFADLECPFCRNFNVTVDSVLQRYPTRVAVVFVHDPLRIHRFAQPAARAAECAALQGRFGQMIDALYGSQDSFGRKSWATFAAIAGVSDTVRFNRCTADTNTVEAIARGTKMAAKFHVEGTPTVMVNSLRFGSPPTDSELFRAIDKALEIDHRR